MSLCVHVRFTEYNWIDNITFRLKYTERKIWLMSIINMKCIWINYLKTLLRELLFAAIQLVTPRRSDLRSHINLQHNNFRLFWVKRVMSVRPSGWNEQQLLEGWSGWLQMLHVVIFPPTIVQHFHRRVKNYSICGVDTLKFYVYLLVIGPPDFSNFSKCLSFVYLICYLQSFI